MPDMDAARRSISATLDEISEGERILRESGADVRDPGEWMQLREYRRQDRAQAGRQRHQARCGAGRGIMTPTECTSYTELFNGIRSQLGALGIRYEDFDELAGFAAGLSGKVFGPAQVKRLGPEKMFDAIRAAGLRLRIEVDPEQAHKMQTRIAENYNPRQANQARPGNASSPASSAVLSRVFKPLARMGGKARWAKKTKEQKQEHARLMGIASGKKRRKLMKRRARQRKAAHQARKAATMK